MENIFIIVKFLFLMLKMLGGRKYYIVIEGFFIIFIYGGEIFRG